MDGHDELRGHVPLNPAAVAYSCGLDKGGHVLGVIYERPPQLLRQVPAFGGV